MNINFSQEFSIEDPNADWDSQTRYCSVEWSSKNDVALRSLISQKLDEKSSINILEIGVDRNSGSSSSKTFLSLLRDGDKYLGVDIEERNVDNGRNARFLRTSSSNYDLVVQTMTSLGMNELDILFIDGWHSLNQVLLDLKYSDKLSESGIIILHDTNGHPGPREIIRCIDREFWDVNNHCPENDDYGLSSITKRRSRA